MGLGKTVQVAVYLRGLFEVEYIKKVLIVVPATMKVYWEDELNKWINDGEVGVCVMQFDEKKKQNRAD